MSLYKPLNNLSRNLYIKTFYYHWNLELSYFYFFLVEATGSDIEESEESENESESDREEKENQDENSKRFVYYLPVFFLLAIFYNLNLLPSLLRLWDVLLVQNLP